MHLVQGCERLYDALHKLDSDLRQVPSIQDKSLLLQAGLVPENIARDVCSSLAARRQCPLLPGNSDGLHCLTRRHSKEALKATALMPVVQTMPATPATRH